MRFLTADYLYPLSSEPIKEGVLQVTDKGEIVAVFKERKTLSKEKLECYKGILCPGFINVHCHLELSHLSGTAGKGLLDFISSIKKRNDFTEKEILTSIENAENQMINNGIVGVGDICNTSDTINQKQKSNLEYYNFIEVFGLKEEKFNQIIFNAKELRSQFRAVGLKATMSPHSPYSVPPKLARAIAINYDKKDELLSIHMQESACENELFKSKSGNMFDWIKKIANCDEIWNMRNRSIDILKELGDKNFLLVHNTFSRKEDLGYNYYCTCPKANLYIENRLPDYSIFNPETLCVGTDSLASNNSLSVLDELQVIQANSNFNLNELLKIASKNGAEALGFKKLGTFEKGKTPGVNLISGLSKIEVIV